MLLTVIKNQYRTLKIVRTIQGYIMMTFFFIIIPGQLVRNIICKLVLLIFLRDF